MMAAHLAITLPPPREDGTPTPQRPERVGVCVPAPGGAWAIVLDTSGPPGESGPIVRWVVRWRGDDLVVGGTVIEVHRGLLIANHNLVHR